MQDATEVRLVLVDALVRDRAGRVVRDLRREELRVFDNGEEVEILQFSPPPEGHDGRGRRSEEEGPGDVGSEPQKHVVVLLDELRLSPGYRRETLGQLAEALDRVLRPVTDVMVAADDGDLEVLLPPTANRKQLWTVLADRVLYGAQPIVHAREAEGLMGTLRELMDSPPECDERWFGPGECLNYVCPGTLAPLVRGYAARVHGQILAAIDRLRSFLAALGTLPGRKTLLYVSDGLPTTPGRELWDYTIALCDGSAVSQGLVSLGSDLMTFAPARHFPSEARQEQEVTSTAAAWEELAAEANALRVTFHTLESIGLAAPREGDAGIGVMGARTGAATEFGGRLDRQGALVLLARETGGRAFLNTNDLTDDLARGLEEGRLRYELAFAARHPPDGRVHRLRVEVTRPGLTVEHRRSYRDAPGDGRAVGAVLGALYFEREENPLGVEGSVEVVPGQERPGRTLEVLVHVDVPLAALTLLPKSGSAKGLFTVFVASRDETGAQTPVGSKSIPAEVGPDEGGELFRYVVRMPLRRGRRHAIAVAVRDEIGGPVSSLRREIDLRRR